MNPISQKTVDDAAAIVMGRPDVAGALMAWWRRDRDNGCESSSFEAWLRHEIDMMSAGIGLLYGYYDPPPQALADVVQIHAVGDRNALIVAHRAADAGYETDTSCYVQEGVVTSDIYIRGDDAEKTIMEAISIARSLRELGYSADTFVNPEDHCAITVGASLDFLQYIALVRQGRLVLYFPQGKTDEYRREAERNRRDEART